ncbi:MAG: sorbosone dehydrogenase [Chitinophagaceae bacterium]|nr:MAG: sorbosone dehydrogenase [Chitinophagaceae bacterium]
MRKFMWCTVIFCLVGVKSKAGNYFTGPSADTATNASLVLPKGFKASIVAEGFAGARHIAVTKQGGIYVKLSRLKDGSGIWYLKDTNGDGVIDIRKGFGNYPGTGIVIKNDYLYASSNDDVFRYKLDSKGEVISPDQPERIITGLVNHNRDNAKPLAVDDNGNIFVNVGSYSNACIIDEKSKQSPMPCPLLDSVGGIWVFKTNKLNQTMGMASRYATGFKNSVAIDWNDKTGSLFLLQHGRDRLDDYPQFYTKEDNTLLPAESMYEVKKGSNGGWPYAYFDHKKGKAMLAPEYGGDGKKEATVKAQMPTVNFPAHLAPNGLLFHSGKSFPAKYKNGAFIAFHGNSAELKKGYMVGFVPFQGNKAAGKWEVFADNFTLPNDPHRPCGLAEAPDGSIYVTDDTKGTIYKISYGK